MAQASLMVSGHWVGLSAAPRTPFFHFIGLVGQVAGMVKLLHHHEPSAVWAVICCHRTEMVLPDNKSFCHGLAFALEPANITFVELGIVCSETVWPL